MSWCSASFQHRWPRRSLLALALLPLAACGFHPMYSEAVQRQVNPQLASIIVSPIPDRYGQQLELALREALNPEGLTVKPLYRLDVAVQVQRIDLGIQRDATSTRGRINANGTLTLVDVKTNRQIYTSRMQSNSAFDILEDGYATTVAEDDARTRTVRDLTDQISLRLGLFLRNRPTAPVKS